MKDIGTWLRARDPIAADPPRSDEVVRSMRRTVIAAASESADAAQMWPSALAVATAMAIVLAAGVTIGRWLPHDQGEVAFVEAETEPVARRQLQFVTPGGTRLIWVLNPEFTR